MPFFTTVYSEELKWLPNGSEFIKESEKVDTKPSTYTSFTCSQDSLQNSSSKPIGPAEDKIILAKLGPGQARKFSALFVFVDLLHLF